MLQRQLLLLLLLQMFSGKSDLSFLYKLRVIWIFSRKEIPFNKLPFKPKLDPLLKTLWSYATMPKAWFQLNNIAIWWRHLRHLKSCKSMAILSLMQFMLWMGLCGMWVLFTHVYSESIYGADKETGPAWEFILVTP